MIITKSIFYFILAGFCEIGGGWLVRQWLRGGKSIWLAVLGAVFLMFYDVIPIRKEWFSAASLRLDEAGPDR